MNRSIALVLSVILMTAMAATTYAQSNRRVPLVNGDFSHQLSGWRTQSDQEADTAFSAEDGALKIQYHTGGYFARAYQDVAVADKLAYELTYRMKVSGPGSGRGWIIIHAADSGGHWLDKGDAVLRSEPMRDTHDQWQTVTMRVPAAADMDKLRVSFSPFGKSTTVWVDDVRLQALVESPQAAGSLVPAMDMRPTLDGRLDEPFWSHTLAMEDFRVLDKPDQRATPATRVRLGIYQNELWIGYELDEPNPSGMKMRVNKPGDIAMHGDDSVQAFFVTDGASVVQLVVNALGHWAWGGRIAASPNPVNWYADSEAGRKPIAAASAVQRRSDGWTAEIRIPLMDLLGQYPVKRDAQNRPIVSAMFSRHRPQDSNAPYASSTPMTGKTFFSPQQYKSLLLDWRIPADYRPLPQTPTLDLTYRVDAPEHLIAGEPVWVQWSDKMVALPKQVTWQTQGLTVDRIVREIVEPGVTWQHGRGTWTIRCRLWPDGRPPRDVDAATAARLTGDEAFCLRIGEDGVDVSGRSHAAVMRGLATLTLLGDGAKSRGRTTLSACDMLDAPALPIRGWMLGIKTPDRIIEQAKVLFLLRYNYVHFEVVGYGANAMFPFTSHPNLGDPAYTKQQWAEVADTIRALGMEPLPMVYCWSRAGYIAHKPQYKPLSVRPDLAYGAGRTTKNRANKNMSAAHEEAYSLIFDLLDEVVDALKATQIHVALDELHYDDMVTDPASQALGLKRSDWVVRVVNRTRDHLHGRGVRMWMWPDNLDPGHNGDKLDQSGPELLAKLPKDVVMHDWKYHPGPYNSLKMFHDAGFPTVSASWWQSANVIELIGDTYRFGADGFIGTTWAGSQPNAIWYPEMATARGLGAFLSWSPQWADQPQKLPVVPAVLYQTAAYRHGLQPVESPADVAVEQPAKIVAGRELAEALGLPGGIPLGELLKPVAGPMGCAFQPWRWDQLPAAVMVRGGASQTVEVPLDGRAVRINILHTTNYQSFRGSIHEMWTEYQQVTAVQYELHYADGSVEKLPQLYREDLSAWNDIYPASKSWPVLFGTVADTYHLYIPALTWANPHPDKPLKSLVIRSGNRSGIDAAVFAVSLIRQGGS